MAVAFSEQERRSIKEKLKNAAAHSAKTVGMKKATVDELAAAAGISKGAFYHFFQSKELLFLEVLEDLHREVYEAAEKTLLSCQELSGARRSAQAVLTICGMLEASGLLTFIQNDVPCILRKIPRQLKEQCYHSDEVHIRRLFEDDGLRSPFGADVLSATIQGLILTAVHREDIGPAYPHVLELLVNGACGQLFPQ